MLRFILHVSAILIFATFAVVVVHSNIRSNIRRVNSPTPTNAMTIGLTISNNSITHDRLRDDDNNDLAKNSTTHDLPNYSSLSSLAPSPSPNPSSFFLGLTQTHALAPSAAVHDAHDVVQTPQDSLPPKDLPPHDSTSPSSSSSPSSFSWRVSNAGPTAWRPSVESLRFYADTECMREVSFTPGMINCSGSMTLYGGTSHCSDVLSSTNSPWRPDCEDVPDSVKRCSPPHFCCDEETAWVSVRFGVKTAVGCIRTVGTLSAGTNPKVQKYGGPALWNGGIVVRTDDGNIVNGFHDVDRPGEWVHV